MNKEQICCDRSSVSYCLSPPSSGRYPYLLTYDSECRDDLVQIFYPIPGAYKLSNSHIQNHYHCRFEQLHGREIRGCFHGWLILSRHPDSLEYSLWNPVTLEYIHLPHLTLKLSDDDDDQTNLNNDIYSCCLSLPPSNPDSILLLIRDNKPNIVFCRLSDEKKRWTEISYAEQLKNISGDEHDRILIPICCNGKVYANTVFGQVILIEINNDDKNGEVAISLLPLAMLPDSTCPEIYLTASCGELITIVMRYNGSENLQLLELFKMDFSTMTWEEIKSAKDRVFFLDEDNYSLISCPASESESGNYVHIIWDSCKLYSYNMEDKTISLTSLPCPDLPPATWSKYCSKWIMPEIRLLGDHGETKCRTDTKEDQGMEKEILMGRSLISGEQVGENMKAAMEGPLLNMPFHILELIAENCVAVDYLNFRATCKLCSLAAPTIKWSSATAVGRLQTHSLVSPWLMVLDKHQGRITFTDPKFGDKYFLATFPPEVSIEDAVISSSKYGWLLIFRADPSSFVFFNPFTKAIIQLPAFTTQLPSNFFSWCCFSAPPTSPDCMVIAIGPAIFLTTSLGEPAWRSICISSYMELSCLTYCGQDLYVLSQDGALEIRRKGTGGYEEMLVANPPETTIKSCFQRILVECSNDVLSIVVSEFGEGVEVFKLNQSTLKWEKVNSLGKHMIYVCGMESFSVIARIPRMENKIYFPRFRDGCLVFYSLDTCKYHTFKGKEESFTDFFPTKEQVSSFWIDPTWSY